MSNETSILDDSANGHQKVREQMVKLGLHSTPEDLDACYQLIAHVYDNQQTITVSPRSVAQTFVKDYASYVGSFDLEKSQAQSHTRIKPCVLDICCGTGLVGVFLRQNGFDGNVDGVDLSKEMLQVAREKGIYRNLFCEVVGGHGSLSLASDSYDGVLCSASYAQGHLKANSLREFARVVRPGGLVVFNLRDDVSDMEGYGRPLKVVEQLSSEGIWEVVRKDKDVEYSCYYHCFMLTCKIC